MKTCAFIFFSLGSAVMLILYKSKERKAEALIRTELSKTLFDFDRYKLIETTVVEA